jgi:hypothetical protein
MRVGINKAGEDEHAHGVDAPTRLALDPRRDRFDPLATHSDICFLYACIADDRSISNDQVILCVGHLPVSKRILFW